MAAGLAARRCGGRYDGHVCLLFHALAAVLDCGPCGDLEGYPLLPHGLLEEHAVAWVVPMPSSEKSFAVSSLVCLSVRTATLTVPMRTSLPRACAIRRSYARQAVCSQYPSWRDGYPSSAATLRLRRLPGSRLTRPTAKSGPLRHHRHAGRERRQGTPEAPHQRLQLRGRATDLHPGPGAPRGHPKGLFPCLLTVFHDSLVGRERHGA